MPGIIITNKLITDIETIADYFDKDSNAILQQLIATELERIMPLIKAKKSIEYSEKNKETAEPFRKINSWNELEKSKPVEGEFAGLKIWERNWRAVTLQILKILRDKNYVTEAELITQLPAVGNINIVRGIRDDSGYVPMQELGISVQGLSAPRVGEFVQKIAEHYKIPFRFKVRWSNSDSADSKEKTGIFSYTAE